MMVMRFTDMVLAFPRLVLLIMIVALFSQIPVDEMLRDFMQGGPIL